MPDPNLNGFKRTYELSECGERCYSGTVLQLVEMLLGELTSEELQTLKRDTIPDVQVKHNTARTADDSKALKRTNRLKAEYLARAEPAGVHAVPQVVWSDELEAEAVAQGRDGPDAVDGLLAPEGADPESAIDLDAPIPSALADEDQPTQRIEVNADPAQWAVG